MKSKQIIVEGKVQGVGFRNFAKEAALRLGVSGWARNLHTSEVEIFACAHDGKTMDLFIEEIKKGSSRSKVDRVQTIDIDSHSENHDTFIIEKDGEKKREF